MLTGHEWERLPATVAAARRHPGAKVAISVPTSATRYNCDRCDSRIGWLVGAGIAVDRIVELKPTADNTRGEAEGVADYVRRHGVRHVLAVTSVYHIRRTAWLFERALPAGLEVGVVSAAAFSRNRPWAWWSRPGDIWYVSYEWAALAKALVS